MSSKNVWTRGEGAPPVRIEKHIRFDSCRQNDVQRTEKTGKRESGDGQRKYRRNKNLTVRPAGF